jgi:hypothetical protein
VLLLVSLTEERTIYLALELDRSWTEMTGVNPLDGTISLDTVSADRTAGNLDLPRHRDTILHPCENEILDAVIQPESRFEVSLWKAASYAISTRLSFLTIRRDLSGVSRVAGWPFTGDKDLPTASNVRPGQITRGLPFASGGNTF